MSALSRTVFRSFTGPTAVAVFFGTPVISQPTTPDIFHDRSAGQVAEYLDGFSAHEISNSDEIALGLLQMEQEKPGSIEKILSELIEDARNDVKDTVSDIYGDAANGRAINPQAYRGQVRQFATEIKNAAEQGASVRTLSGMMKDFLREHGQSIGEVRSSGRRNAVASIAARLGL